MPTYTSFLTIPAAAQFIYGDIDPPEREGYGHRIVEAQVITYGDDTANDGKEVVVGASMKAVARTNWTPNPATGGFAPDIIALLEVGFDTDNWRVLNLDRNNGFILEEPIFQDSIRLFMACPANVATSKSLSVAYRLQTEDVKLSNQLLADIQRRMYT